MNKIELSREAGVARSDKETTISVNVFRHDELLQDVIEKE